MKIGSIGTKRVPFSIYLYGPQGAGKSTCAADFEDPVFISGSEGASELSVRRVEFDDKGRTSPSSWDEILNALTTLKTTNGYKTLVVDELQAIELLCAQALCVREKVDSLGKIGGGFGKGEVALLSEMRKLLKACEDIWATGKNVVFCSHSKQGKVSRPETGDAYQRYEPALTSVNNADIVGMFVGWVNAALFIRPEIQTAVASGTKKTFGISSGRRVMHTEGEAAWIAKCRYKGVDPELEIPATRPMAEFFRQVSEGQSVDAMKARVKALAEAIGGDMHEKVTKWLATGAANDLGALHDRVAHLKATAAA